MPMLGIFPEILGKTHRVHPPHEFETALVSKDNDGLGFITYGKDVFPTVFLGQIGGRAT